MNRGTPSIACIGIIGRHDNPLHITLFPASPTTTTTTPARDPLDYHFLLTTSLDIFTARLPSKPASHDFGLLQAIDERLAMYGWLTNTGVKFVVVVDMEGRAAGEGEKGGGSGGNGLRDADLRPVFRAVQRAYIGVLRNPFYEPEGEEQGRGKGGVRIRSKRFEGEMRRIGEAWYPGITAL